METISMELKRDLSMKEIAKRIRNQLKQEFPALTFSVRMELYSGGGSISVNLMKSDFRIVRDVKDISDMAFFIYEGRHYKKEQITKSQQDTNHQLNHHQFREFKADEWNNGVFLTEKGHNTLRRVVEIAQAYNWDNSDSMTDYFDVNYYLHLELGKWDKPFIDGIKA